jgi:hypothetical protein
MAALRIESRAYPLCELDVGLALAQAALAFLTFRCLDFTQFLRHDARIPGLPMKSQAKNAGLALLVVMILVAGSVGEPFSVAGPSPARATTTLSGGSRSLPATAQTPTPKDSGTVRVNTEAGVYHKPGSRSYGKTKKGKYMLESDGTKAGHKPSKPEK